MTVDEFKELQKNVQNIKYVNCPQITKELLIKYNMETPGDPFNGFKAFTNDSELAKPYLEKFVVELKKSAESPMGIKNEYSVVGIDCDRNKKCILTKDPEYEPMYYGVLVNHKGFVNTLQLPVTLIKKVAPECVVFCRASDKRCSGFNAMYAKSGISCIVGDLN